MDAAPLQVTQFESDIRIAEQLLSLWLENRGGDGPEDYELLWYFAAKHTDIDCFNKRGEKGFCFSIGDAPCHEQLNASDVKRIFHDDIQCNIDSKKLAEMATEKYDVFHIMIGNAPENFQTILMGKVLIISKSDIKYLPEIIISVMQIARGAKKENVLKQWGELARCVVERSLSLLNIGIDGEMKF